jgi:hypothetical protein
MPDAKQQVIERIDEVIAALAAYEDRCGCKIELIVRPDGTCELMGEEDTSDVVFHDDVPPAFESIGQYGSIAELMADLALDEASARREVLCEQAE